jgi:hypothetical protein
MLWGRSEHTLPITGLYCGMGANPIVVTASLDRSCKVWSLAQGIRISPFLLFHLQSPELAECALDTEISITAARCCLVSCDNVLSGMGMLGLARGGACEFLRLYNVHEDRGLRFGGAGHAGSLLRLISSPRL